MAPRVRRRRAVTDGGEHGAPLRIGYLVGRYPAISHAFILREVVELRRAGVDVRTISIHATDEADLLAEADRREHDTTFAVLPTSAARLLRAHAAAFGAAPLAYLRTLAFGQRASSPGLRARVWQVFWFAEAMIVRRHCEQAAIRHLHAQFADSATDVAMLVAHYDRARGRRASGISWSLKVHGSVEFYNVVRHGLETKLAHARFALAISDFGRSQLLMLTPRARWDRVTTVHCGVDPDAYAPAARGGERDDVTILTVARLVGAKGLPVLFAALAELVRAGRPVRLELVGDGPERDAYVAEAQRLGIGEHVRFLGAVGQDELRAHYAQADVFCLPSFAEGIPVVLMEAMAMELPVVTTPVMGIPELVTDGVEGLLVAPGRAGPLRDALERLVAAPELRARMGAAGRRKVLEAFDVRTSARELAAIFARELH
jgi:colanic acid/amylovoran biosynthesis glycosyltransferase